MSDDGLDLELVDDPRPEDVAVVAGGLIERAEAIGVDPHEPRRLGIFLRDGSGRVVAGLVGRSGFGWLSVDLLWVAPERRGGGLGTRLMRSAEREAARRGCRGLYLETFEPSAAAFYRALGYRVFGSLPDFPRGRMRHFLARPAGHAAPLRITTLDARLAVCRLAADAPVPTWAASGALTGVVRTEQELSIVCDENRVPPETRAERGFRALRVDGPLPFDAIGVIASLAGPLAASGIPILTIGTFDTDYLLIRENDLPRALATLRDAGDLV